MKYITLLIGLVLFATIMAHGQKDNKNNNKADDTEVVTSSSAEKTTKKKKDKDKDKLPYRKHVKYANKLYGVGNYYQAAEEYLKLTNDKPENSFLAFQLGECKRQTRDYKGAEKWYEKAIELGVSDEQTMAYYWKGMMQKQQAKYDMAKNSFSDFIQNLEGDASEYKSYAQQEIQWCDDAKELIQDTVNWEITHLGKPLNKPFTDYAPTVPEEDVMYYSSLNNDTILNARFMKNGLYLSHIYRSSKLNGEWQSPEILPSPVNSDEYHTGNPAFSEDGKRMYFTRCTDNGETDIQCKIFMATYDNGRWGEPKELSAGINAKDANNTQPAVAPGDDGDILYFSSNREGGYGGYDIYYSEVNENGTGTAPENLGKTINTDRDEVTPYYFAKRKRLFFSSDGHPGLGGYDIFKINGEPDDWKDDEPINMGFEVNSPADDLYFTSGKEKRVYYLVSNRPGIIGLKSETCCDDLFKAKDLFIPVFAVSGQLKSYDEAEDMTTPLENVKVEVVDVTDPNNPVVVSVDSFENQSDYVVPLKHDREYQVKYNAKGHFAKTFDVSTVGLEDSDTFSRSMTLDKIIKNKTYRLSNIYYDYNSAELREASKGVLDTLSMLLEENEEVVIELAAHTDNVGSEGYNQKLSQERAQSCVDYLINERGISKDRLVAKGYGESEPLVPNEDENGKAIEENMAKNRRTEFKVIGELDWKGDKIIYE